MDKVKWYKTKVTIEVEVQTQFGPNDAINLVDMNLRYPAITGLTLLKVESDYVPLTEQDLNREAVSNVPRQLR
jgi:hypothetical protein